MKRSLMLGMGILMLWQPAAALAQTTSTQTLGNDDIVQMVQAKLADQVIIAKIKSSQCKFDTSTDALIKLKIAGVSDAVLQAMAEYGVPATTVAAAAAAPPPDPNDPDSPHAPGIYYYRQDSAGRQMTELEPTSYAGQKMGGFFKSGMTGGLAKVKSKVAIQGSQASLRLTEARPTFYFYFEEKAGSFGSSGGLGESPSSPNDFVLARMERKKNARELVVGQMGMTGGSSGVRSKDTVPYDAEKLRPGVYKVQLQGDLEPGEYCFFFARSGQTMGLTGGKLFDFGVNIGK
jgi:hypothetical protein